MIGLSRMISLSARSGCGIYEIVDQLNSCGTCSSYATRSATKHDTSRGSCCPTAIGNALLEMYQEMQEELGLEESAPFVKKIHPKREKVSGQTCPTCGEKLYFEGGCNVCKACGWSKCD
jgi:ribonucleoside-diphosphate reductase alpha chain